MELLLRIIVPNISTEYFSGIFQEKTLKKNVLKVVNFVHLVRFRNHSFGYCQHWCFVSLFSVLMLSFSNHWCFLDQLLILLLLVFIPVLRTHLFVVVFLTIDISF